MTIGRYEERRAKNSCEKRRKKDAVMNNLTSFGFWTCAAVYAAIGVIGVFFFSTQPNIANAKDGYGTIRLVASK
jgi:hypothetical protein